MTATLDIPRGIRSRHYDPAPTAALVYGAGALTPVDLSARAGLAGASLGHVVQHANLAASWTPILSTDLAGYGPLTHKGSYRVWARVYTTSATPPQLRFLWDVGDFTNPSDNTPVAIPGTSNFYLVDLGEIRLDRAPVGAHRWKGVIQGKGALGGENVSIDQLYFQPLDEAAGRVVATTDSDPGLATYVARDEFNQSAGNLSGKTLPIGGTWSGAGVALDFSLETTGHTTQRTASSEAQGRYAVPSVSPLSGQVVQVDIRYVPVDAGSTSWHSVLARYVDTNNWLRASLIAGLGAANQVRVEKRVAGVLTTFAELPVPSAPSNWHRLQLLAAPGGCWAVWFQNQGASPTLRGTGWDADLAAGGALASGKPGIYDAYPLDAASGYFDNFAAWVPTLDAVVFANRHAEIRTDGSVRETSDSGSYGPTTPPIGDLPRIPPSGEEGRTVEVLVIPTRGDLDALPDSSLDPVAAQLVYRPSYLFRPPDAST